MIFVKAARTLILLVLVLFIFSPAFASYGRAVEDAESIIKRPDGRFDVKCNDGTREIVTVQQLKDNEVCRNGSSIGRFQVECEGSAFRVYPVRAKDGFRFGSYMSGDECLQVARAALRDIVCSQVGTGNWYITRISDGKRLGRPTNFNSCIAASYFNRQSMTCAPFASGNWRPTKVQTGETIGFDTNFEQCLTALKKTREGVVCGLVGNGFWAPYRIKDRQKLGAFTDFTGCTQATDDAFEGKVCVNRGSSWWQGIVIATEQPITDMLPLGACITKL
ncbi:MAG: hypothetical protein HY537_18005 [Deltaproteobacteria bacterium]|nr:hypothetical protein [Deltaproteobacteria bacterium]